MYSVQACEYVSCASVLGQLIQWMFVQQQVGCECLCLLNDCVGGDVIYIVQAMT